jgi:hypothetical protein
MLETTDAIPTEYTDDETSNGPTLEPEQIFEKLDKANYIPFIRLLHPDYLSKGLAIVIFIPKSIIEKAQNEGISSRDIMTSEYARYCVELPLLIKFAMNLKLHQDKVPDAY